MIMAPAKDQSQAQKQYLLNIFRQKRAIVEKCASFRIKNTLPPRAGKLFLAAPLPRPEFISFTFC